MDDVDDYSSLIYTHISQLNNYHNTHSSIYRYIQVWITEETVVIGW